MLITGEQLNVFQLRLRAVKYGVNPTGLSKKALEKAINAKIEELRSVTK